MSLMLISLHANSNSAYEAGQKALTISFSDSTVIGGKYFLNNKIALLGGIGFDIYDEKNSSSRFSNSNESNSKWLWAVGGIRYYFKNKSDLYLFIDSEISVSYQKYKYTYISYDPEGGIDSESTDNRKSGSISIFESLGGEYRVSDNLTLEARFGFSANYRRQLEGDEDIRWSFRSFRSQIGGSYYF